MGHCGFPECPGSPLEIQARPARPISVSIDVSPVDRIMLTVRHELDRARRDHAPMHSAHEGSAVIQEEFDELWEHVKANTGGSRAARAEAIQLAAMAVRYVLDVCDSNEVPR